MKIRDNFTIEKLDSILLPKKRTRYFDLKTPGLILDVLPSGRKSFRVYKKIKGKASPVSVTLGQYPSMKIYQARKIAYNKLEQMAEQINPNEQAKEEKKKNLSLLEVFEDYKRDRKLEKKTLKGYTHALNCYLSDWKNTYLHSISETMVSNRHREITKRSAAQADLTMRFLKALFNYAKHEYKNTKGDPIFAYNPVMIINHKRQWNNVARKTDRMKRSQLKSWFKAVLDVQNDPDFSDNIDHNVCLFLQVAILTGLRKEELFELK